MLPDRPVIVDVEELATLAIDSAGGAQLHPEEVLLLATSAQRVGPLVRLATKQHRQLDPRSILFLSPAEVAEHDRIVTATAPIDLDRLASLLDLAGVPA